MLYHVIDGVGVSITLELAWHSGRVFFLGKQTFHIQTQIERLRAIPSMHVLLLSPLLRIYLHRYPNLVHLLFGPCLLFQPLPKFRCAGGFRTRRCL